MPRYWDLAAVVLVAAMASGCASRLPSEAKNQAHLTPQTQVFKDLSSLPAPRGRVPVAVYSFRDQTGQYKPQPDSSFSTSVTQGAAPMLVRALLDSQWFVPVERENLQNLLTERRIARALTPSGNGAASNDEAGSAPPASGAGLPPLRPAGIIIEGSIIAYESNVKTGGAGVRYLGVGISDLYRMDQVSINLRAIDIRNGHVLESVSTTKTIYSFQLQTGVFRFVSFKNLLEAEAGFTRNEPVQLCVQEAIETGLIHLIVQGVKKNVWALKNPADINSPLFQNYDQLYSEQRASAAALPGAEPVAKSSSNEYGGLL